MAADKHGPSVLKSTSATLPKLFKFMSRLQMTEVKELRRVKVKFVHRTLNIEKCKIDFVVNEICGIRQTWSL